MEPADLNSPSGDDVRLDAWLSNSAALPPLADDGFSARVVATLPPAEPRSRHRFAAYALGAAAGLAFAAWQGAFASDPVASLPDFTPIARDLLRQLAEPPLLLALTAAALSILYALPARQLRQLF